MLRLRGWSQQTTRVKEFRPGTFVLLGLAMAALVAVALTVVRSSPPSATLAPPASVVSGNHHLR